MKFRTWIACVLWAAGAVGLLSACGGDTMSNRVLAQNEQFTVTGDSVTAGSVVAVAPSDRYIASTLTRRRLDSLVVRRADDVPLQGGAPWYGSTHWPEGVATLSAVQTLQVALYNMSVDYVQSALSVEQGFTWSLADRNLLWMAITQSLALTHPEQSRRALMRSVGLDGVVLSVDASVSPWYLSGTRLLWTVAAYEVYKATGDSQWLRYAYDVGRKTWTEDASLLIDELSGLPHGLPAYLRALTTRNDESVKFGAMTLASGILMAQAAEVLDDMAEDLSEPPGDYAALAEALKGAVNQRLWNERAGRYGAVLCDGLSLWRSGTSDNLGQALAVLIGVADDDRAETLLSSTPIGHNGVPLLCGSSYVGSIEPYFDNVLWPLVQSLWCEASARVGNENGLRRGLAALWRASALFASRRIAPQGWPDNRLPVGAALQATVWRTLFGVHLLSDGIELQPYVPACLPGTKTLAGWHYRDATLTITLMGTGSEVKRLQLDGKPVEGNYIPAEAIDDGVHRIVAELRGGARGSQRVTLLKSRSDSTDPLLLKVFDTSDAEVQDAYAGTVSADSTLTMLHAGRYLLAVAIAGDTASTMVEPIPVEVVVNERKQGMVVVQGGAMSAAVTTIDCLRGRNRVVLRRMAGKSGLPKDIQIKAYIKDD